MIFFKSAGVVKRAFSFVPQNSVVEPVLPVASKSNMAWKDRTHANAKNVQA
jgi:hypothetical protein